MSALGESFVRPRDLGEACARVADLVARGVPHHVIAGGTDLVVESHLRPPSAVAPAAATLVDVSRVPELVEFAVRGDTIRLGGGVTFLTVRRAPALAPLRVLVEAGKDVGAIQIQARGTLAGNVVTASPAGDGVAALMALEAVVGLRSVRGERAVPLRDYYQGYKKTVRATDELVAWLDVRVPAADAFQSWRKVGTRLAQAISKVALAAVVERDGETIRRARFGMASVAPTTSPLAHVERYLEGRSTRGLDLAGLDAAVDADVSPIDDVRSTAEYRRHVARALVREVARGLAPE
ncbi:MAG: FAD binding domain-containing protein [Myxococcales bacterium]|nr:FAD binding domain-containing protein [Myxococcales bacterium]